MKATVEGRKQEMRIRIRESAKRLFLRQGFQGISTDAILAAAGVASKETLYRYFRSKEELFIEVVRSMTVEGPFLRTLIEHARAPRTDEELRSFVRSVVQEMLKTMLQPDYLALMRMTVAALPTLPELGEVFRQAVPVRAMGALAEIIRQGQALGAIGDDRDPEVVARTLLGVPLTYGVFDGLLLPGQPTRQPGRAVIDQIVENLVDGICARRSETRRAVSPRRMIADRPGRRE